MKKLYLFLSLCLGAYFSSLDLYAAEDTLRLRVGSIALCPGEVKDIPIYIEGVKSERPLSSIYFHLYVSDSSIFELVTSQWDSNRHTGNPVMTEVDPVLARLGPAGYNYMTYVSDRDTSFLPRFMYSWYDGSTREPSYIPQKDVPVFKLRIRCKKKGKAYLMLNPKSDAFYNGIGREGPNVHKFDVQGDTGWITNSNEPIVFAGEDRNFCVGTEQVIMGATGGVAYEWRGIGYYAGNNPQALRGVNMQNPKFKAEMPGLYNYEVKISDPQGCYSFDTVQLRAEENSLDFDISADTIIDKGGRLNLRVRPFSLCLDDLGESKECDFGAPYTVQWTPDTIALNPTAMQTFSKPISEPILIRANVTDAMGCTTSKIQIYNVGGGTFSGKIDPFPIYHCGENNFTPKTVQLNLQVMGGSGKYTYLWSGIQLESGEGNLPPVIRDVRISNPTVTFYGKTAFQVNVHDENYNKDFVLYDTVTLLPDADIDPLFSLENTGLLCEGDTLVFKAGFTHGGNAPLINWFVNDRVVATGSDTILRLTDFKMGDKMHYMVYSNRECVLNSPAASLSIQPDIKAWTYPSVRIEDTSYRACGDSARFLATVQNAGKRFDLTFFLNGNKIISQRTYDVQNSDLAKVEFVYNPSNYYDFVSCMVSNATAQCMRFDNTSSGAMYPLVNPLVGVKVGGIVASALDTICAGQEVKMYLSGVENLGEAKDILIRWMRKAKEQTAAQEILRYAYDADADAVRMDLQHGFPIVFNVENAPVLNDGDSIYCVLESRNPCVNNENAALNSLSKDSTRALGYSVFAREVAGVNFTMPDESRGYLCEGDAVVLKANPVNAGAGVSYQWYKNEMLLPLENKELLQVGNFLTKDTFMCEVKTNFACVLGYPIRKQVLGIDVKKVELVRTSDTSLCFAKSLQLFALGGVEYAWTPLTDLDDATLAMPTTTTTENRMYTVEVTDAYGCKNKDSVYISVIPLDADPMVSIEASKVFLCAEEEVLFTASVQYADSIAWFVNGVFMQGNTGIGREKNKTLEGTSKENISPSPALKINFKYTPNHKDTIYAVVHSSFDCTTEALIYSNKIGIERYTTPLGIEHTKDTVLCVGDSLILWASHAEQYQYRWYSLTEEMELTNSCCDTILTSVGIHKYYLKVYDDSEACAMYDSVSVTAVANESPTTLSIATTQTLFCEDNVVTFTAEIQNGDSLLWVVNDSVRACKKGLELGENEFFTYLPKHNDSVFAKLYSSKRCAIALPVVTPKIRIEKYAYPLLGNVSADTSFCYGESMPLKASGATHYIWMDAQGTPLFEEVETGCCATFVPPSGKHAFVLRAYEHAACSLYDTVQIDVIPYQDNTFVKLSTDRLVSCTGDSVHLVAEASNGSSLTWYVNGIARRATDFVSTERNRDTLVYVPVNNDSVYVRLASSSMCARNAPAYSEKLFLKRYNYPALRKSMDTVLCLGQEIELFFSGASDFVNFSHAQSVTGQQEGNRFVFRVQSPASAQSMVFKIRGYMHAACAREDSIRISYRELDERLSLTSGSNSLCLGQEFSFLARGLDDLYYSWMVNGVEKAVTAAKQEGGSNWEYVPELGDSLWVVQHLTSAFACGGKTSIVSKMFYPEPVDLIIRLNPDVEICLGDTTELSATTNASSFIWRPSLDMVDGKELVSLAMPKVTTHYVFSAMLGNCLQKDTVTVTVLPLPEVPLVINGQVCPEAPQTTLGVLRVKEPDVSCVYRWFRDTLSNFVHEGVSYEAQKGLYFVSAHSLKGCKAKGFGRGEVVLDAPVIADFDFTEDSIFAGMGLSFENRSENADIWAWNFGDGKLSTLESPTHLYDTKGSYWVSLHASNANTCFDTLSVLVEVFEPLKIYSSSIVFIPSAFAPQANNADDKVFKVYGTAIKTVNLRVTNAQGVSVFKSTQANAAWDGFYEGKLCPAGTYFYEAIVETTEGEQIRKVGNVSLIR